MITLSVSVLGLMALVILVQKQQNLRSSATLLPRPPSCSVSPGYYDVKVTGGGGTATWKVKCGTKQESGTLNLGDFLPAGGVSLGNQYNPYKVVAGSRYSASMTLKQVCSYPSLPAPAREMCNKVCAKIDCSRILGSVSASVTKVACKGSTFYAVFGNGTVSISGSGTYAGVRCVGSVYGSGNMTVSLQGSGDVVQ